MKFEQFSKQVFCLFYLTSEVLDIRIRNEVGDWWRLVLDLVGLLLAPHLNKADDEGDDHDDGCAEDDRDEVAQVISD